MALKPGSLIFVVFYASLGAALGFGLALLFDNLHIVESWLTNAALSL